MLKTFGLALLLASGLAIAGAPVRALQIVVTQVDKNTDGSMTYHFAVKTDQGETLAPGEAKEPSAVTRHMGMFCQFFSLRAGSS